MEWINIKEHKPPIGLEVIVKTIYGFEDTGIWDGEQWVSDDGIFKGEPEEAPEWISKGIKYEILTKEQVEEQRRKAYDYLA